MRVYSSALVFFGSLLPELCLCQSIPSVLKEGLANEFHFSAEDFAKVESGQAVAHMAPTGRPDDVRMAGIVLIRISSEAFVNAFRDIERFEISKDVIQTKRFSEPPVESDLADFRVNNLKKSEILACRPGRCSYKLPAEAMAALQTSIDWNAPDAMAKAEAFIHRRLIAYLANYRLNGDPTLAVYYDTESPYSVAEGLRSIIGSETRLAKAVPDLIRFASEYPANRPANTEDFFYWQEAAFGLKHVFRAQHVVIQRLPGSGQAHYAIISKMLFATHYFRTALEFKSVYPVRTSSGQPAIYLVTAQRSFIDGLTGAKGAILRKIAENRSPASLVENLQLAKAKLEHRQ